MSTAITITPNEETQKVTLAVDMSDEMEGATVDIIATPQAARGLAVRLLAAADVAEGRERRPVWIIANEVPQ